MPGPRVNGRVFATMALNACALAGGASAFMGQAAARAWPRPAWDTSDADALGTLGSLEVRLAARRKDVRRAQRVRYKVFYEEGSAVPDRFAALRRRDLCPFDSICDHLIVLDHAVASRRLGVPRPKVVGTYRLLRQEVAARHSGFYSAGEFDIGPLLARHPDKRFLELGRSCVLPDYRSKRTIELLWRAIWVYVERHAIDVLIGCASLNGTDLDALALPLSFIRHHAPAEARWNAHALPRRASAFAPIPAEAVDRKAALARLPPLVKGYLRAGARFGEGVVIDHQFGTTDVFAVMPLASLDRRYLAHFGSA